MWGEATTDPNLINRVADLAKKVSKIQIEVIDSKRWRPTFTLSGCTAADYQEFFNSPNGYRGHYYVSVQRGEQYNQSVLNSIVQEIDWGNVQFMVPGICEFHITEAKVQDLIRNGKVWTVEKPTIWRSRIWDNTCAFQPNNRWMSSPTSQQYDQKVEGMRDDVPANLIQEYLGNSPDSPINKWLGYAPLGSESISTGSWFWENSDIDIKGAWNDGWKPARKKLRSQSIRWFGFS